MSDRSMPQFPEPDTLPFWEATKNEKLKYQQCSMCNSVVFYPRFACTHCGSDELEWKDSKGEGEIYTYSVVRQNRNPAFADDFEDVIYKVQDEDLFLIGTSEHAIASMHYDEILEGWSCFRCCTLDGIMK